ncbi:MAG: helix-turn-helix domain-containing protein [Rhodothermales bacterium]|nr:helix-turn-helix domain-containing protein [Rhodothermales bacterium]MBO6781362.1 helix-turn-helix domain-containing protein [Rhodothermales bacterium]
MIGLILLVISLAIAGVGLYRAEKTLFSRGTASADASARQLAEAAEAFPVEAARHDTFESEAPLADQDFPIATGDGVASVPGPISVSPNTQIPVANDQVLVVDLDQKVRSRLREILGDTYSVVEAENAARAVSMMSRRQPALAIVGSNVKDRHGRPFWEWMRRSDTLGQVPVLLITALTAHEDIADRFDHLPYRPSAVLRKPLLIDEVGRTVSRIVEGNEDSWSSDPTWGTFQIGNDEDARFVRRAQQDVEGNIANPSFGVRELSAEMGLSARQLQRRLRETTGQSPNSFIRSIRLQQAARMLEHGSEPVSQVAYAVGFNSLSYFAKCFREHFGRNPSEFTARRARTGASV